MVKVYTKFKSHGKKGKWHLQNVKTEKEAKRIKRFVGKEGIVKIERERKKPATRKSTVKSMFGGFKF